MAHQIRSLLIVAAFGLIAAPALQAQPISLQNPFRSYNLSGINYGSQQWERDHARSQAQQVTPAPVQQFRVIHRPHRARRYR